MKNPIANPRRTRAILVCRIPQRAQWASRKRSTAFTLIEILVVISIIALLAALVVYILPAAKEKSVRSRIKTELAGLETAINSYQQKRGFYPPDNTNNGALQPDPAAARTNSLYYELTGQDPPAAVAAGVFNELGVAGIINSGDNSQNFMKNLKLSAYAPSSSNPNVTNLIVPYKGPQEPNRWYYNSSRPKYNTDSYDLWAEVIIGSNTNIIGNWK
jgi:prepilin-type N-terminal cleavage/methylation domain-containing protein